MDASKFLGKVIGIYLVFVSIAMLVNRPQFINDVNVLINDAPSMVVTGFFTLILGILLVVSHNIWQWNWRVLITLLAWLTLLKGITVILYPQFMNTITIQFMQNINAIYVAAGVDLILGILLCYFGFKGGKL